MIGCAPGSRRRVARFPASGRKIPEFPDLPHAFIAISNQPPSTGKAARADRIRAAGKPPYDVTPDGQRFIVSSIVRRNDPSIHVLLNWTALLNKPN